MPPIVLVRQMCRVCRWSTGHRRQWIATKEAAERWNRCPFCGEKKPLTKDIKGKAAL